MLPLTLKHSVFDKVSGLTMRIFFHPVNLQQAHGLLKAVLLQSQKDFFINGTITSHSAVPELMAGMWLAGREITLVDGYLPAWLKKAMGAALSEVNQCPYCEDMLLSLTLGAQEEKLVQALQGKNLALINDKQNQQRMAWVKASTQKYATLLQTPPFTPEQMPEALGNLIVFGYTNRISDFTLNGSPVPHLGRRFFLKLFGRELEESVSLRLTPGLALDLLPESLEQTDLHWALPNPLVADSLARWSQMLDKQIRHVLSEEAMSLIRQNVLHWEGGPAPISRAWVEEELTAVSEREKKRVRIALLVAKASYQIDDGLIQEVVDDGFTEAELITLGAWSAFLGAKTVANWCWEAYKANSAHQDTFKSKPCLVG